MGKEYISVAYLIEKRQKYIDAELIHFRSTNKKSVKLRAKVSLIDEILNENEVNNR